LAARINLVTRSTSVGSFAISPRTRAAAACFLLPEYSMGSTWVWPIPVPVVVIGLLTLVSLLVSVPVLP
jgi:hypothetical protein